MKQRSTDPFKGSAGNSRRYLGALLGAGFVIVSIVAALVILFVMVFLHPEEGPPIWFVALYLLLSVLIIAGTAAALRQRIRELRKGEEDEARKY